MSDPLLQVRELTRRYPLGRRGLLAPARQHTAVDGVSFAIEAGTIFGIVGESGCGKSTLARLVMALDRPSGGQVLFDGADLFALPASDLARARRGFQMVFQDPYGSLDPQQRVRTLVAEPLHLDRQAPRASAREALVAEMLSAVGLRPEDADRFPHQFSGGQRQRIAIARALITQPRLVVADEPVSALDLSVQAQVLNLLLDLRDRLGVALLFISHNLAVVESIADRLAVMYLGRFVETGPASEVFRKPLHPYTRVLIASEPRLDAALQPPPPVAPLPRPTGGCAFASRCPLRVQHCLDVVPSLRPMGADRSVACHRAEET